MQSGNTNTKAAYAQLSLLWSLRKKHRGCRTQVLRVVWDRIGGQVMTHAELVAENQKLKAIIAKIGKLNLDEITPSKLIAILRELHESK
jgi:hypothetical protein